MATKALRCCLIVALVLAIPTAAAAWDDSKQPADAFPSDVASAWFDTLYDVVKTERTTPPPASRIYGISSVALYESIVAGTIAHRSLIGQLNELSSLPQPDPENQKYYWPAVANSAIATAIRGLYPAPSQASADMIDARELEFASQFRVVVPGPVYSRSVALGMDVAKAVLAWAASDGLSIYNDCPYDPAPVLGAWEPTPPSFSPSPVQPCWGQLRPMVLTSGAECRPPDHPQFSTNPLSEFFAAALEVYEVTVTLTQEEKTIADYWADNAGATGTPPGHWIAIVGQIARNDRLSLAAAAEAYARVGIAVHDAFIQCWHAKYVYNLQRPVTYINRNIDPLWRPYITTPGFPSYTSGHSAQSAAAARVLTDMFGIKPFTDTTHTDHELVPPQAPRSFNSFDEAAGEAAVSRLYGGIHYSFDNNEGFFSGDCIGTRIYERIRFTK
jgi:hypothetical protein